MEKWGTVKAICIIAGFYLFLELVLGVTCPILYFTGISCAGCGMSRAWMCLLHLDFAGAFYYHPLFWIPGVGAILFPFWNRIPEKMEKGAACSYLYLVFRRVYLAYAGCDRYHCGISA